MKRLYSIFILWIYSFAVFAAEMTNVPQIDNTLSVGKSIIEVVAKWGGIALLVAGGIMFGLGKAKGEAIGAGFYIIVGLGIIAAAFGWWQTIFTSGFAF